MELCGILPHDMIDKSRKKDLYFAEDYSPYLIEDEDEGLLRIPESKTLEDTMKCRDNLFIDFIRECLVLDPEKRISATQAMKHPWITKGM